MSDTAAAELTQIETLALPFLDAAFRIDGAKQNLSDREAMIEVLDSNVAMWMFYRNFLTEHFFNLPEETKHMLVHLTEFITKAATFLRETPDEGLLDRIIQMNLNMSEQILRLE